MDHINGSLSRWETISPLNFAKGGDWDDEDEEDIDDWDDEEEEEDEDDDNWDDED